MTVTATRHPGKILFVDADGTQPDHERDASEVPESIRFADTAEGPKPVVRVVKTTAGDTRFIEQYGEDGALLRRTVQKRAPAPPPPPKRRPFTTK